MPFSVQEVENISNAVLDHHMRGQPMSQSIQEKPLLDAMNSAQKTFPGGRGAITGRVKNDYTTQFMGYSQDDIVTFRNPANIKVFSYNWYELHAGLEILFTELKEGGITISDTNGEDTANASDAEQLQLCNILEDKLEDFDEGGARSLNSILWLDGTQSAKVPPGILSIINDTPDVGVVGGIDASANSWWRNDYQSFASSAANQTLTKGLRAQLRKKLRRYGGKPTLALAGSGFLEKLEVEIHEKGTYTQEGFASTKATDITMSDINMKGVGKLQYDPTLDDMNMADYLFLIDPRNIFPMVMSGENMKRHNPARPFNQYVLYRAVTDTRALICNKRNSHGLYKAT